LPTIANRQPISAKPAWQYRAQLRLLLASRRKIRRQPGRGRKIVLQHRLEFSVPQFPLDQDVGGVGEAETSFGQRDQPCGALTVRPPRIDVEFAAAFGELPALNRARDAGARR
jgi:hypothetical protein